MVGQGDGFGVECVTCNHYVVYCFNRKPFALQYAQRGMPKERWNDAGFIRGCRFITIVWACLMTFAVLISIL